MTTSLHCTDIEGFANDTQSDTKSVSSITSGTKKKRSRRRRAKKDKMKHELFSHINATICTANIAEMLESSEFQTIQSQFRSSSEFENFYLSNQESYNYIEHSQQISDDSELYTINETQLDLELGINANLDQTTSPMTEFSVETVSTNSPVSCAPPAQYTPVPQNGVYFNFDYAIQSVHNNRICDNRNRAPLLDSLSVTEVLSLKLGIKELIELNVIRTLMMDQQGSRYLQNILKPNRAKNGHIITLLINHLMSNNIDLTLMAEDMYANYVIQLFFVCGNDLNRELLCHYFVYNSILRLCKSKYGCRVIQKIFSCVSYQNIIRLVQYFEEQTTVVDLGKESVHKCMLNSNTNHVIQAMIQLKLPYETVQFIGEALESNLIFYSENIYACRVVQSFIENYGNKLDVFKLFENGSHLFLSHHRYGNYVIQCIIAKNKWYANLPLIKKFKNKLISDAFHKDNILYLSKDKHGSNVMETCIRVSSEKQIDALIKTICSKQGFLFRQLLSDRFGNYIPKTVMSECSEKQKRALVNATHLYVTNLYEYNACHDYTRCSEFIEKCQKIKCMDKHQYY